MYRIWFSAKVIKLFFPALFFGLLVTSAEGIPATSTFDTDVDDWITPSTGHSWASTFIKITRAGNFDNTNYGTEEYIAIKHDSGIGWLQRKAYIRFDLSRRRK